MATAAPAPLCLLVPRPLRRAVATGGAEIVVERRPGGRKRFFLHVMDESEREEAVRRRVDSAAAAAHERALQDMRAARAVLLADPRMRAYLPAADTLTWPTGDALKTFVDLVRAAKETDATPDFAGAAALSRAYEIICSAHTAPGLYALRRASACATDSAFALYRNECFVSDGPRGAFVADAETAPPIAADAIPRLRLTPHCATSAARAGLFRGESVSAENWDAAVRAHVQCCRARRLGLFHSAESFVALTGAAPHAAARRVADAATMGRRVRLRAGLFLTVVQRAEVFVVRGAAAGDAHACADSLAENFAESFAENFAAVTGRRVAECVASGDVLRLAADANAEALDTALRERFLGPLAAPHVCTELGAGIVHVTVPHNPCAVVHGPRVAGGSFAERAAERAALSELLSAREGTRPVAPPAEAQAKRSALVSVAAAAEREGGGAVASAMMTGEQLRRGVDEALIQMLTQAPMTRAVIAAHENMSRFRGVQNFDAVLKDALRRHTEYQGRKYHLKE